MAWTFNIQKEWISKEIPSTTQSSQLVLLSLLLLAGIFLAIGFVPTLIALELVYRMGGAIGVKKFSY